MISSDLWRVVTLNGECFDIKYQHKGPSHNRDGVLHYFHVTDVKTERLLCASVFRAGTLELYVPNAAQYERRENVVVLNALRRAFDKGTLSFEKLPEASNYQEIQLQPADFEAQPKKSDAEVREYMIQKAYYLSALHPLRPSPNGDFYPIPFSDEIDLEYLGIKPQDVIRNVHRLGSQGMFDAITDDRARPTEKLLLHHETGGDALRRFARTAIDEARKSVTEDETKIHPKVGAVVVMNGRVLSVAHRGEKLGNHAEYIAMEIKLSNETLVGATVYTTLEPCTTRNHPKVPCAERLIERGVAKVVIGMLDPDKRITGLGLKRLQNANIIVEHFPHDLVPEVQELNRDFTRDRDRRRQAEDEESAKKDRIIEEQRKEIVELKHKPYAEALQKKVEILLSNMSSDGKILLRHLLENEPLEVGRQFMSLIPSQVQSDQMMIAINSGIVRLDEVRNGIGHIVRTNYVFTNQYREALRDLLYER